MENIGINNLEQVQLLESLYRASEALKQNEGRGHVIEFQDAGMAKKVI